MSDDDFEKVIIHSTDTKDMMDLELDENMERSNEVYWKKMNKKNLYLFLKSILEKKYCVLTEDVDDRKERKETDEIMSILEKVIYEPYIEYMNTHMNVVKSGVDMSDFAEILKRDGKHSLNEMIRANVNHCLKNNIMSYHE